MLVPISETVMTTAVLPLSRTARAVAFAASLLATSATLFLNLGLVHSYANSETSATDLRAECASQKLRLGEEMAPHENSKQRPS